MTTKTKTDGDGDGAFQIDGVWQLCRVHGCGARLRRVRTVRLSPTVRRVEAYCSKCQRKHEIYETRPKDMPDPE